MTSPIYTEKTICRDCYKCVRQCPVKAIKVNDGHAVVMHDLCIFCGKCIEVCPVHAKKLRSDTARAKQMISLNKTVFASVAPSFPAEFDCTAEQLISALKTVGFSGVSETAIGAEIISRKIADRPEGSKRIISSACPTVNELIKKYRPELVNYISDIDTPLQTHAKYLKELYGEEVKIIFIGPCISKKLEADDEESPVDLALTFKELHSWFDDEGIKPESSGSETEGAEFIPEKTLTASEFAIEGGMLNTIKKDATNIDSGLISCSGIKNIMESLDDIIPAAERTSYQSIFLEYLACDGGCISGKGMTASGGYLTKRFKILDYNQKQKAIQNQKPPVCSRSIEHPQKAQPVNTQVYSEKQLANVLRSLDKHKKEDEINCGGCGYNTCRDFAVALLEGKAEQSMCVTYMRKLAEKKSNALMRALPLGAVITDGNKRILECNSKFLSLFSEIDPDINAQEKIEGAALEGFIPDCSIFDKIKNTSSSMLEDKIHINDRIFRIFVFRVGSEDMLGAVFQDITSPAVRRETIIKKTEEVIEKSLSSVQQIASLLGENAAETQLILNSLIESYNDNGSEK